MPPVIGAKMEQKQSTAEATIPPCGQRAAGMELERLQNLIRILYDGHIPARVRRSLNGLDGLKRIAAGMTIVLTDFGGTTPEETCAAIAEELPDLYAAFGEERVLAICKEIQHSEILEQSARFQEMYRTFNGKYLEGRLPEYRIWLSTMSGSARPSGSATPPRARRLLRLLDLSTSKGGAYSSGIARTSRVTARCRGRCCTRWPTQRLTAATGTLGKTRWRG
jgi:hypothetical protein